MRISDWSSDVCSSDLLAWSASTTSTATAKPVVRIAVRFMPSPSPHGRGAAAAQILMAGDLADLGQHLPAAFAFVAFGQLRYHRNTAGILAAERLRSEEHTSELQSLMRISYAVFCLKKKNKKTRAQT